MAPGHDPATSGKLPLSSLTQIPDTDPSETDEWLESLDAVIAAQGGGRARYLMLQLLEHAKARQVGVPEIRTTDYINTIPAAAEPEFPGDEELEERIRSIVRWNAAIMVTRANKLTNVGGHIATFAGAAELYEIGWNHFFKGQGRQGRRSERGPDLLPGPRLPRHVLPRLPRGPAHRRPARRLPPGAQPRRPVLATRTRG